jgi:hypothetical protein
MKRPVALPERRFLRRHERDEALCIRPSTQAVSAARPGPTRDYGGAARRERLRRAIPYRARNGTAREVCNARDDVAALVPIDAVHRIIDDPKNAKNARKRDLCNARASR